MITPTKVLARRNRPTTKSYRAAVKAIVTRLQADHCLHDQELADRLGCSRSTIKNARTEASNLDGVTLANVEYEFGPAALDPFLELGGSRAVPLPSECSTAARSALPLSLALHSLIEAMAPDSDGGVEITESELARRLPLLIQARASLDAMIEIGAGKITIVTEVS